METGRRLVWIPQFSSRPVFPRPPSSCPERSSPSGPPRGRKTGEPGGSRARGQGAADPGVGAQRGAPGAASAPIGLSAGRPELRVRIPPLMPAGGAPQL